MSSCVGWVNLLKVGDSGFPDGIHDSWSTTRMSAAQPPNGHRLWLVYEFFLLCKIPSHSSSIAYRRLCSDGILLHWTRFIFCKTYAQMTQMLERQCYQRLDRERREEFLITVSWRGNEVFSECNQVRSTKKWPQKTKKKLTEKRFNDCLRYLHSQLWRIRGLSQLGLPRRPRSTPSRIECGLEDAGWGGKSRERKAGLLTELRVSGNVPIIEAFRNPNEK